MLKLTLMLAALSLTTGLALAADMQIGEPSLAIAAATDSSLMGTDASGAIEASATAPMNVAMPAAKPSMDTGSLMGAPTNAMDDASQGVTPEGLPADMPLGGAAATGSMAIDAGGTDGDNEAPPSSMAPTATGK